MDEKIEELAASELEIETLEAQLRQLDDQMVLRSEEVPVSLHQQIYLDLGSIS